MTPSTFIFTEGVFFKLSAFFKFVYLIQNFGAKIRLVWIRYTLLLHVCFKRKTFISNTKLKLVKIQAKNKQHPEAKFFLFENYLLSSSRHHPKVIGMAYSRKCEKSKCVCFNEVILSIMKMKIKMKKRSHRYDLLDVYLDMNLKILNIKCVWVWWC